MSSLCSFVHQWLSVQWTTYNWKLHASKVRQQKNGSVLKTTSIEKPNKTKVQKSVPHKANNWENQCCDIARLYPQSAGLMINHVLHSQCYIQLLTLFYLCLSYRLNADQVFTNSEALWFLQGHKGWEAGNAKHWLEERNCLKCWLMSLLEAAVQWNELQQHFGPTAIMT